MIVKLLNDVNIVVGRVLFAVKTTVPVLGVQVVPVPPTLREPVLKVEFADIVSVLGELLLFPNVRLPQINVEPLTKVMVPDRSALPLDPPIVMAPPTVSIGLPLAEKMMVPLVLSAVPPN